MGRDENSKQAADLRATREAAKLSRDQLGKLVWRSGRTVEKWEQGLAPVPPYVWRVLEGQGVKRRRTKTRRIGARCDAACLDESTGSTARTEEP